MLKPIVSMNQMAMNESIATTCCYVWNGTSLLGSASLPHGGSLKAGSKTQWYVWNGTKTEATNLNSSWLSWQGGHVTTAYAGLKLSTGVNGDWIVYSHSNDGNWDTLYKDGKPVLLPHFLQRCLHPHRRHLCSLQLHRRQFLAGGSPRCAVLFLILQKETHIARLNRGERFLCVSLLFNP